jgi:hypothetical protein
VAFFSDARNSDDSGFGASSEVDHDVRSTSSIEISMLTRVFSHQFRDEPDHDRKMLVLNGAEAVYCRHSTRNFVVLTHPTQNIRP